MNNWKETLITLLNDNIPDLKELRKLEAEARQFKKKIEGTATKPSEFAIFKKQLMENWETVLSLVDKEQEETEIKLEGTKLILENKGENVELEVRTSSRVDSNAVLNQLAIDGIVDIETIESYKEKFTKESKSFIIK